MNAVENVFFILFVIPFSFPAFFGVSVSCVKLIRPSSMLIEQICFQNLHFKKYIDIFLDEISRGSCITYCFCSLCEACSWFYHIHNSPFLTCIKLVYPSSSMIVEACANSTLNSFLFPFFFLAFSYLQQLTEELSKVEGKLKLMESLLKSKVIFCIFPHFVW